MHTFTINVNDSILDKFKNFIDNFSKNEVEIIEEKEIKKSSLLDSAKKIKENSKREYEELEGTLSDGL